MAKKKRFPAGQSVQAEDLKMVKKGMELKDAQYCYHIETKYHPDHQTRLTIEGMEPPMKLRVIDWIKKGRIFIRK